MYNASQKELMDKILELKQKKSVYIIAHYYQRAEVQDVADFVGDSYAMAIAATKCDKENILVAGVDFMAESAAILCPDKTILTPEPSATCPMSEMVDIQDIIDYKRDNPDSLVISYVNTSAEIKAETDICCTSSNAVHIISQIPVERKVIFLPDINLTGYVSAQLDREIDTYPSYCPIHNQLSGQDVEKLKEQYPDAAVLVHPECNEEVRNLADFIGSTSAILNYAKECSQNELIIATEGGIFHSIAKVCPDKKLILANEDLICPNMKSITLDKIYDSIKNTKTIVKVPEELRQKAHKSLEEMIRMSS